jgi:hypothetical protein
MLAAAQVDPFFDGMLTKARNVCVRVPAAGSLADSLMAWPSFRDDDAVMGSTTHERPIHDPGQSDVYAQPCGFSRYSARIDVHYGRVETQLCR